MKAAPAHAPVFAGTIPQVYDQYMVPLVFEPYAIDLAQRLVELPLTNVLELACGTGAVTRRLAMTLPGDVFIIATDLAQPMLDYAAAVGTHRAVEWRQADALQLPFDKGSFDAVVCQFGATFFPDRVRGFAEVRRVLRAGGVFIFNTWDRIEENEFAAVASEVLAGMFPDDPPSFMARVPHGYHDAAKIRSDLAAGGFSEQAEVQMVAARSRAASARIPAVAYCQGTPMRNEIESRAPARLDAATDATEAALAGRFGHSAVDGKIQALVVTVEA
jgi:ubiquinone/menaquinone biosynthesis C-methylase UbiE